MEENAIVHNMFDIAVLEYKEKQKEVVKNFVRGCIELWQILHTNREVLKAEWKWMEFCEAINIHITQANQQIRLYEYSIKKTEKDILWEIITNWAKLNLFLSLTDDQKDKLIDSWLIWDANTEEFREKIIEIKNEENTQIIDMPIYEEEVRKKIEEQGWWNPMLHDTKKASKLVQESLKLPTNCREPIEAILHIEKAKEVLRDIPTLSIEDKDKLKAIFLKQMTELKSILDIFFN